MGKLWREMIRKRGGKTGPPAGLRGLGNARGSFEHTAVLGLDYRSKDGIWDLSCTNISDKSSAIQTEKGSVLLAQWTMSLSKNFSGRKLPKALRTCSEKVGIERIPPY